MNLPFSDIDKPIQTRFSCISEKFYQLFELDIFNNDSKWAQNEIENSKKR